MVAEALETLVLVQMVMDLLAQVIVPIILVLVLEVLTTLQIKEVDQEESLFVMLEVQQKQQVEIISLL